MPPQRAATPPRSRGSSAAGADVRARDGNGRTPLHVAAYASQRDAMRALVEAGADPNALEGDRYDIVTIAAVANDLPTLKAALALGCSATNVTSRYDGTALIAAAHLGHVEVVRELIRAGAPLDHVNNLGWTALIESIVLGDGGPRHTATLEALVDGGREREPRRSRRRDAARARDEPRLPGDGRAAGEGGGALGRLRPPHARPPRQRRSRIARARRQAGRRPPVARRGRLAALAVGAPPRVGVGLGPGEPARQPIQRLDHRLRGLRPARPVLFQARRDQRVERFGNAGHAARRRPRRRRVQTWLVISRLLSPSKIGLPVSRK